MKRLDLTSEQLVSRLLAQSEFKQVCLLDSCGTEGWGGGLLIAGIAPSTSIQSNPDLPESALSTFARFEQEAPATFFTLSYELGSELQGVSGWPGGCENTGIFAAAFDALVIHRYSTGETFLAGSERGIRSTLEALGENNGAPFHTPIPADEVEPEFEIKKDEYIHKVETILEYIRAGDTYQTNLTQKIRVPVGPDRMARHLYADLRVNHPAAFSAFIDRGEDQVVSISPERFLRTSFVDGKHRIEAAPIKGTRPRNGKRAIDRENLRDLITSSKDRAENTMITDLLRNDLGRVCLYGSVRVDSLCEVQELPTLFHLVSRISGDLKPVTGIKDILTAAFPCGSITGCPKIRTMQIIKELEPSPRGLSMGSIGFAFSRSLFPELDKLWNSEVSAGVPNADRCYDLNVAIRTVVVKDGYAEFNVGGGVVIDSDPLAEYAESLDKAKAILSALGASGDTTVDKQPTRSATEQST
ncbi:MAG: anthranilate synthase component I family protein [Acidobacteria bacterium]|nr:MAG: anthranilate synthase component I family protein [Acidobacteriota bacterium]REK01236.1 MAG: anthranilate synthase component I family protein [Acidobacteriota bacterium]REK14192.1 MAG: anthranilate synthase component I family protein [Acidobacteriota bacterium]REK44907.1 MAG: anthranilate synthase component I family protein [Acidobacteriota bacterium]